MSILDDYKDSVNNNSILTEEEQKEVERLRNRYEDLDMRIFIERIGGQEKIDEMKEINTRADKLSVVDGKAVQKEAPQLKNETKEDLEEWKKGFVEGFEEAYKRLYGK